MAIAATATTFLLVVIGALVRATGSGLGCTGWPKCSAHRWLPPLEHHAIIEYSHRMTAFVAIVLVGCLAVVAWRRYRDAPRVLWPSLGAVGLIIMQAVLGGIVVKGDLATLLVTAHFATAMILVATLVYVTVSSFSVEAHPPGPPDGLTSLARLVAAATLALLIVGAYVRGEGAGLAFGDWPLMQGRVVPPLHHVGPSVMFAHRVLALAVGILIGVLAFRAWRMRDRRPALAALASVAAVLFLIQVLVGAALVWSKLSAPARVAHVAVGTLVWGALVAVAAVARLGSSGGPEEPAISAALAKEAVA